jgi:hypothetical protein
VGGGDLALAGAYDFRCHVLCKVEGQAGSSNEWAVSKAVTAGGCVK